MFPHLTLKMPDGTIIQWWRKIRYLRKHKFRLLKKSFQIFFLKIGDNICSVFGIALTFHSFIDFIFFWDVQTLVRRVVYIPSQPISINLTYQISRSWLATFFAKTNLCCTMMDFVFSLFCVCFFFHKVETHT